MLIMRFFILFIFYAFCLQSAYVRPPEIEISVWRKLKPHFLPEDHPIKSKLDQLFASENVIENSSTLYEAGFTNPYPGKFSLATVTKHPKVKGYIFKLFTHDQNLVEWPLLLQRIKGAHFVRKAIKKHNLEEFFKVPAKWLYLLNTNSTQAAFKKHFILVAEDMQVLKKEHNYAQWAGATMTPKRLDAFFTLVQEAGLSDSVFAFNAPFCKDGKIAFIDTQQYHNWPVPLHRLTHYLTKRLQPYWEEKINPH